MADMPCWQAAVALLADCNMLSGAKLLRRPPKRAGGAKVDKCRYKRYYKASCAMLTACKKSIDDRGGQNPF